MRGSKTLAAVLAGTALALSSCGHMGIGEHGGHAHAHHQALAASPIPGDSVYQLTGTWQQSTGRKLKLADMRGKTVVGAMIYSSCEYACPLIVSDMKRIEFSLSEDVRDRTQFVLFSFDPERDTPETLASYREQSDLLGGNWSVLRAEDSAVRELAVVLGVRYKKTGQDFAHTNLIVVLDSDGVPAFRQEGLGAEPDQAAAAITRLAGADE